MTTLIVFGLFLALLLLAAVFWALCLRLGLYLTKVPGVTARRVVGVTVLFTFIQIALTAGLMLAGAKTAKTVNLLAIANLLAAVLIPCFLVAKVFKISLARAFLAWLPTLASAVVMGLFTLLIFRPYLVEAFVSPSNAMAPTLLGNHWRGTCAECGGAAYCSPIPPDYHAPEPPRMICEGNFHITQPTLPATGNPVFNGDRFLVAKFLKPKRWDLVVFRYPDNPSTLYVMRLVGLPGEEITIQDGDAFANGERLPRPESLRGIKYFSELEGAPDKLWGAPDQPAKLGDDEYFVLGDFSTQANDSRVWREGAPGHPTYALPQSHLYGVVTHTYWPPSRWRALR